MTESAALNSDIAATNAEVPPAVVQELIASAKEEMVNMKKENFNLESIETNPEKFGFSAEAERVYCFQFKWFDKAKSVILTGDFLDWQKGIKLQINEFGYFDAIVYLSSPHASVKFLVDGKWEVNGGYWISVQEDGSKLNEVYGKLATGGSMANLPQLCVLPDIVESELNQEADQIVLTKANTNQNQVDADFVEFMQPVENLPERFGYSAVEGRTYQFRFNWMETAESVFVTGDFLSWKEGLRLQKDSHGLFGLQIFLNTPRTVVKFLVDGNWMVSNHYWIANSDLGRTNEIYGQITSPKPAVADLKAIEEIGEVEQNLKEVEEHTSLQSQPAKKVTLPIIHYHDPTAPIHIIEPLPEFFGESQEDGRIYFYHFQWSNPADSVFITGDFLNWKDGLRLHKNHNGIFELELFFSAPRVVIIFLVDGCWAVSSDYWVTSNRYDQSNNEIYGALGKPMPDEDILPNENVEEATVNVPFSNENAFVIDEAFTVETVIEKENSLEIISNEAPASLVNENTESVSSVTAISPVESLSKAIEKPEFTAKEEVQPEVEEPEEEEEAPESMKVTLNQMFIDPIEPTDDLFGFNPSEGRIYRYDFVYSSDVAENAYVTGDFVGWYKGLPLKKQDNKFVLSIFNENPKIIAKFLVDGEWKISVDHLRLDDAFGNSSNEIFGYKIEQIPTEVVEALKVDAELAESIEKDSNNFAEQVDADLNTKSDDYHDSELPIDKAEKSVRFQLADEEFIVEEVEEIIPTIVSANVNSPTFDTDFVVEDVIKVPTTETEFVSELIEPTESEFVTEQVVEVSIGDSAVPTDDIIKKTNVDAGSIVKQSTTDESEIVSDETLESALVSETDSTVVEADLKLKAKDNTLISNSVANSTKVSETPEDLIEPAPAVVHQPGLRTAQPAATPSMSMEIGGPKGTTVVEQKKQNSSCFRFCC